LVPIFVSGFYPQKGLGAQESASRSPAGCPRHLTIATDLYKLSLSCGFAKTRQIIAIVPVCVGQLWIQAQNRASSSFRSQLSRLIIIVVPSKAFSPGAATEAPSQNRTEVERITQNRIGRFDALPSASPIWTIYYRFRRFDEGLRSTTCVIEVYRSPPAHTNTGIVI